MLENADCHEGTSKGDSGRGSERKEGEWVSIFLKNTQIITYRTLAKIWILKVIFMKSQKQTCYWLMEKILILTIKNLAELCLCSLVLWKVELVSVIWDPSPHPSFLFLPLGMSVLCLSHHCILEAHNLEWNGMEWMHFSWEKDLNLEGPGRECYAWIFLSPPNSYVEIIMPNMMEPEGGPFGRWLGHEARALWVGLVP